MSIASLVVDARIVFIDDLRFVRIDCPLCGDAHWYPEYVLECGPVQAACDPFARGRYIAQHPEAGQLDLIYELRVYDETTA